MAATKKANVFVPEIATEVATAEFAGQLALGYAGAPFVEILPPVDKLGDEGDAVKFPRWNALGDFADLVEDTAMATEAMGHTVDTATVFAGGKAVEITDFAALAARGDPSEEVGRQVARLAARYLDRKLIAEAETTALSEPVAGTFTWAKFVDAIIKHWGDAAFENVGGIVVHSKVLGDVMKLPEYVTASNVIAGVPANNERIRGTIGGFPLFVSDRLTLTAGTPNTYTNLVLKRGALGVMVQRQLLVESDRDILKKNTVIAADVRAAVHLFHGVPQPAVKLVTQ
jgi:hypothetical protein